MADAKITSLTNSSTINDTDVIPVVYDVAGTPATEKRTWAQVKAFLKTYFDTLYQAVGSYLSDVVDDTTPTLGGDLDVNSKDLQNIYLPGFKEYDNGNSGTSKTIDWNNGALQKVTLTGNCTITFTAPTGGTGNLWSLRLKLVQDGTGSRTVTWPTIKWADSTVPTLTTTATTGTDIVTLEYDGTNYYGIASVNFG